MRPGFAAAIAATCCLLLVSCSKPLPEAGTPPAELYAMRCGACHPPHHPHVLTAAMWKVQVERMEKKFGATGRMPVGAEREQILDYLTRNAGR